MNDSTQITYEEVRADANIRVVDVTATSSGGTVNTIDYTVSTLNSSVNMPNNSTVTYTVKVTNLYTTVHI